MIPTSTQVTLRHSDRIPADADALAVFVNEGAKHVDGSSAWGQPEQEAVARLLASGVVRGKSQEISSELAQVSRGKLRRIYVVGLGPAAKRSAESVRKSAGSLLRAVRRDRMRSLAVVAPTGGGEVEALVQGILLTAFDFSEYKGSAHKPDDAHFPARVAVVGAKSIRAAVERTRTICDAQNFARTIGSRPGNAVNPPELARVAAGLARQFGLKFRALDEKQMKKMGMGGILAVGGGAIDRPPRMIVLEYQPRGAKGKPLMVVGKAITFDAGGISIKPADNMGLMIYDKSGAMTVLGVMCAVAQLRLHVHLVGILASAENVLSQGSYRPGDILRMYNGVTVDVTNTDAEGRLVLGDALAWGIETYHPSAVVDLATLTGGVVVALGKTTSGVMSNSDELVKQLGEAAETAGEKIWRLPLTEENREQMRGLSADLINAGGREASPSQGAAFLSFFVPDDASVPWAHLDIAGAAHTERELPYYAKGSTGWGVRTLVEWIARRSRH